MKKETDSIYEILYPELWQEPLFSPSTPLPASTTDNSLTAQSLQLAASKCQKCALHLGRNKAVVASGNPRAELVVISPPPSTLENENGIPLPAGPERDLFAKMLAAIQQQIESVYFIPAVRCHPPAARKPTDDELQSCQKFLTDELSLLQPKAILALGESAAQILLATRASLENLRAPTPQNYQNIPVVCSYTPADLIGKPDLKRGAWEDLKKLIPLLSARV